MNEVVCIKKAIYGAAMRGREIDGFSQTIEINDSEKSNALTSVLKGSLVADLFDIRKLTPIECERLQEALPDNYTSCASDSTLTDDW